MSSAREEFLRKVGEAVVEGNHAGGAPGLPARGTVGYQGAGADLVSRFVQELTAAGGRAHVVHDGSTAVGVVLDLVRERGARRVLLGRGTFLDSLNLESALNAAGVETSMAREDFFPADLGITGVDHLIAETGSVVLGSRPWQPRSLSLLPPVHVAVAHHSQLLPDLFDLFDDKLTQQLPSGLTLITGPSKTGDIELRLVTGVHGPGEVHVVLVRSPAG
jgi:L-lactate utilization protein LutC